MVKADQLILTAGDQKHWRHEMARRRCWRGNAEIDAQEEATPQRHQLDVRVLREAEPFVELTRQGLQVGIGRAGGDGPDAGVLGRRQDRHRPAEGQPEHPDGRSALCHQDVDSAPQVATFADSKGRGATSAFSEVSEVHEEHREVLGQCRRDRQHLRFLGRIAMQDHDTRGPWTGNEPAVQSDTVLGVDRDIAHLETDIGRLQRDLGTGWPNGPPEGEVARHERSREHRGEQNQQSKRQPTPHPRSRATPGVRQS